VRKLFSEMRRRRVIGTAAIYLACAWAVLQVCDVVFPILELPDVAMTIALYVLVGGFPLTLIVSWIFDIEFKRTASADAEADEAAAAAADTTEEAAPAAVSVVPQVDAPPGSIAVLPFRNLGARSDQEYFSDGLAEELLHLLSGVPGIRIAARTSCFMYRDRNDDVRTIGAQLGVRTVLEGSVRWAGERIRVTAQLIEARTGYQLFSRNFDRQVEDVFMLQDEIAGAIVDVLRQRLGPDADLQAPTAGTPTANFDAYKAYLRGRHCWQRRGADAIRDAIALFERAIELDPSFARARSALAAARAVLCEYTGESRDEAFEGARALAREALALDPLLAEPHAVLGYIDFWCWRWRESEEQYIQALSLDAHDPLFHQWYANLLNDLGRQDDALAAALKAYELDRVSPMANNVLAVTYALQGQDGPAQRHVDIALEFGVGGLVPALIAYLAAVRRGDFAAASSRGAEAMAQAGFGSAWVAPVVAALEAPESPAADASDGSRFDAAVRALRAAEEARDTPPNIVFLQYVLLGAAEPAFALADRLLAKRRLNFTWLMLPEAAALRDDPRFERLASAIGLTHYWEEFGRPALKRGLESPAPVQMRPTAEGA
jgi:TolB-like protein